LGLAAATWALARQHLLPAVSPVKLP